MVTRRVHLFSLRSDMINVPPVEGTNHGWVAVDVERDVLDIVLEDAIGDVVEIKAEYK